MNGAASVTDDDYDLFADAVKHRDQSTADLPTTDLERHDNKTVIVVSGVVVVILYTH